MKRPRWLPDPYRRFAPPAAASDVADEPAPDHDQPDPPREFTPEERAIQRKARMQVLLIGGIAVGGIVCMIAATALVLWGLSR